MSESNNLPQAISHKKLNYLMLKAQKESHLFDQLAEIDNPEKREFDELINTWEATTKKVIKEISKRNDKLLKDKPPSSLIALGAMEVHLNMALQALNAFNKDIDENT